MVSLDLIEEILYRPVTPWVLRLLNFHQTAQTKDEIYELVDKRFKSQGRSLPNDYNIKGDIEYLLQAGLLIRGWDHYFLSWSGTEVARKFTPPSIKGTFITPQN